jgi:hypothetical protein
MSGIDFHGGRAQGSQLATLSEGRTLSVDGLRAMYFMCKGLYLFNNTYPQGCGKNPHREGCAHEAQRTHTFTTILVRVMRYNELMTHDQFKFNMSDDQVTQVAKNIGRWLIRCGQPTVTLRDIYASNRLRGGSVQEIISPVNALVELGWLAPMFEGPIKFGVRGKPSPQFQVHPSLLQREKLEVNIPPAPDWPNT